MGGNKEFAKISIFLGLFEYTTNGRELKFKWGKGKKRDWCAAKFETLGLRTGKVCFSLLLFTACLHHKLCFCFFFVGVFLSLLCSTCYPGTLVRSLFPSPLLCTGNPNDQDESRGGILRPYPARENAPSCGLNNAAISTSDSGQQTFAEPQVSPEDPLGPLPENWEMAYTESGELYFIEYVSGDV